jgi:prophage regulatory protein
MNTLGKREYRPSDRPLPRLLRMRDVIKICGLSRSSIYAAIRKNEFPDSVSIGLRARAWVGDEVDAWIAERINASRPEGRPSKHGA